MCDTYTYIHVHIYIYISIAPFMPILRTCVHIYICLYGESGIYTVHTRVDIHNCAKHTIHTRDGAVLQQCNRYKLLLDISPSSFFLFFCFRQKLYFFLLKLLRKLMYPWYVYVCMLSWKQAVSQLYSGGETDTSLTTVIVVNNNNNKKHRGREREREGESSTHVCVKSCLWNFVFVSRRWWVESSFHISWNKGGGGGCEQNKTKKEGSVCACDGVQAKPVWGVCCVRGPKGSVGWLYATEETGEHGWKNHIHTENIWDFFPIPFRPHLLSCLWNFQASKQRRRRVNNN